MTAEIPAPAVAKLEKYTHYVPESGCHIYAGTQKVKGYGVVRSGSKNYAAHRLAWVIANGPIPDGMSVLHKCDTPSCCNPHHLRLGSNQENIDDAVAKGRRFTKLTPSQVLEIRSGVQSVRSLARRFSVSRSTVRDARLGQTWNKCMRSEYEH